MLQALASSFGSFDLGTCGYASEESQGSVTWRDTREGCVREHSNHQGSQSPSCLFQQHSTWECYFWIDSTQHWESQVWNDSFQAVSKSEKDRHSLWGDLSCEYLHLWNCLCGRGDILKHVSRHFNGFQFPDDVFHLQWKLRWKLGAFSCDF